MRANGLPDAIVIPRVVKPACSWWTDPAFQRGDRTAASDEAQQRMREGAGSLPGENRVVGTMGGRI